MFIWDGGSVPCKIVSQLLNCLYSSEMWAHFTFITGPWIRLVLPPSPRTPCCSVLGIRFCGIVGFWCIFVHFFQTLCEYCTNESRGGCSAWGWEAFAFWDLPSKFGVGCKVWHEQNIVISALWDVLGCSCFLCPAPWVLLCGTLILCGPHAVAGGVLLVGTGQQQAQRGEKMPTACLLFLLSSWAKGWLLAASVPGRWLEWVQCTQWVQWHNECNAPLCTAWQCPGNARWGGLGNLWTQLTHSGLSGICNSFHCYRSQNDCSKSQHLLKPLQAPC